MLLVDAPEAAGGTRLLTPRIIGDVNRSRVIQALCDGGPLTRAQLSRRLGVPRGTIGVITAGLMEAGVLVEGEPVSLGAAGKPGVPLWFRPGAASSLVVAVHGRQVRGAVVDARGDLTHEAQAELPAARPSGAELREALEAVLSQVHGSCGESCLGIGIALPATVTRSGDVVASAQLPRAVGSDLTTSLGARFGLPVHLINDASAQALGEKWFGEGRGLSSFASVHTGLGLGVGLVLAGSLFRGDDGVVGELGHVPLQPDGEACRCGLTGCWETIASVAWLRRAATARGLGRGPRYASAELVADVQASRPGAAELLEEYADNLGRGLATLVQIAGVRTLLLHGDVPAGGPLLVDAVAAATRRHSLPAVRDAVSVRASALDQDATLLGAAGQVLSESFRLVV